MAEQNPKQPEGVWVSIPFSLMAVRRYKIALNIRELTALTNDFSKKYVGGCVATLEKSYPKKLSWQYRVKCSKADSDPAGHVVRVVLDLSQVTSTATLNDLQVRCSCSCPAFLYWGAQWHLHQQNALEGDARPLLQAPTERLDLRTNYLVCKHVQVVSKQVIPGVSRVLNGLTRTLKVDEIRKNREEELRQQEEDARLKEEARQKALEEFNNRNKKQPKKTPKQRTLEELQGRSPEERQRLRRLIDEEEKRLMEKEKGIGNGQPLFEPENAVKPRRTPKKQPRKQKSPQVRRPGVIR